MPRLLGVDYGERRIGLAISDPTGTLATPLEELDARQPREMMRRIAELCRERQVTGLVVGLPINMNGTEGPSAQAARAFAEKLRTALGLPVELADERFSSVTANQALILGGTRREQRKEVVDKLAAQILLQHHLDRMTHPSTEPYAAEDDPMNQ